MTKFYHTITANGQIESHDYDDLNLSLDLEKEIGNHFETTKETQECIAYLKARAIIKQDTKGFKPDWQNADEERYCGKWDFDDEIPHISILNIFKAPQIYFKSKKDIQESFKKHPDEWKTYLTYNQ
jgi:hypothetical protein